MAYTALYRKFRPTKFEEIVGQEHITKTLRNQITAGRVGHAYLFNGGRGTGKTSAAKILARAINCLNPKEGEPCNECEICKEAILGSLTDIVEMDAASNNSVEDIRQIRDEVNFLPTKAKYRVYIIDEVHMLSTGAFNALLKTLEEPPEHVKFILATTEPQKLPATILSRCQRFDFKKIDEQNILKRLKIVCEQSNIEITEKALNIIAYLSEGALRDALSILERCIQEGSDKIDEEKVKDLVGIPKLTYINKIIEAVFDYNAENAIKIIEEVISEGKDLNNFLWEIIKYVRDILVYKTSNSISIYNDDEKKQIIDLSKKIDNERLLSIIYDLSSLQNDMKWSSQKVILFQVGIIKLCNGQTSNNIDNTEIIELRNKISMLENKLNQVSRGNIIHKKEELVDNESKYTINTVNNSINKKESIVNLKEKNNQTITPGNKMDSWSKIVTDLKQEGKLLLYTNLINTTANEINDMTIGVYFSKGLTSFGKTLLEKSENINELEKRVSMEFGKPMKIKFMENGIQKNEKKEATKIESLAQDLDLPFNVID